MSFSARTHSSGRAVIGRRPGRAVPRALVAGALVAAVVLGAGCQRSLFSRNESRTQFERFEMMRGEYRPAEEPDVFGNPQPALRARLLR
ncbi:MAG: hypothetical protein ACYTEV_02055 [Planctomycetota bacterium]|jgi:hypothetical protein